MATDLVRVAFLGLGAMGLPMACNLAEAGFEVAGFDVAAERSAQLAERGGRAAATPADAARGAQVVAAIPFDADQERAALFGPNGALETLDPGGLVILMATIGPVALRALAADITARGFRVVDAPVTGGASGAQAGTLTVIASGAAVDLAAAAPILKPMSGQVFQVGTEPGQGQMIKMVNQLLVGTHLAAAAEAMALARAAGADLQQVYDLLITGQARSQIFVSRVGAMLDGGFQTGSSLRIFTEKDMPLVLETGRAFGVPMVTASAALQTMQLAAAFGLEDASDAKLIHLLTDPVAVVSELTADRDRS
ncbi:MAG: NAD(P)-dependent oxidoreductase [Chloroflexi bacterium]|nr:NAD(P)-dependent oxidoreductase [Chloroflexota bacterium]